MVFLMYLVCLLFSKYFCILGSGYNRNIPPHDTFSFRYGQFDEYTWRNSGIYHVGIFNDQFLCYSLLLTLEHVLTTAGCFVPMGTDVTKMLAYGGTMFYYLQDPRVQVRAVKEVIIHEKYTIEGAPNDDIALAVVTPPFIKTFRIDVAHLPNRYMAQLGGNVRVYLSVLGDNYATIFTEVVYMSEPRTIECYFCPHIIGGNPYDGNKRYTAKFMCVKGKSNRDGPTKFYPQCYTYVGCPVMSYQHEIIAICSMSIGKECSKYEGTNILVRETKCDTKQELLYIQVFPYVHWIKSNIRKNRLMRFRPYRIPTKDINLKPYIPLIVYITLFAIVIVVFLICNRAVFGRIRF